MVGFMQSPTIEEAIKEEKEDVKIQSLSDSKKPATPNEPLDLCIPELEDLSLSFSDSFLDFDSINGWFMEGNSGGSNMADLGGNPVDFDSVRGELGDSKENFECGDGICKRDEVEEEWGGKEESLWGLGQEKGGNGVVERIIEMGSEGFCEKINVEGVVCGDGSAGKLGDVGCLIEEQLGKVNLDGASNCLAPIVSSGNDEDVGGGVSVVNGGEVSGGGKSILDASNCLASIVASGNDEDVGGGVSVVNGGEVSGGGKSIPDASNCLASIVASGNDEDVGGVVSVMNGGEVGGGGKSIPDAGDVVGVNGNGIKIDGNVSESGSDVESEGESSSASSSSSSSSGSSDEEDEDEDSKEMSGDKKVKNGEGFVSKRTDLEDGEVMLSDADKMVAWSDNEDVDEDGGGVGPITSKNELRILPPVPSVNVTLQPHHETLPVGTILSIIGPQVVVEGVEKHNPLSEGSILWITEGRSPLGIIDEIFGPVKNPYYIVRYNSESEVPPAIQQGTLISFVPEFANHVLNDKSLYQKGYDASGENDEELSDEAEFSDDEKEAEYRRMLKMKKRGTNESKPGNKGKDKRHLKNRKGNWNRNHDPAAQTALGGDKLPVITEDQHFVPPVGTSLNQDNHPCSSGLRQGLAGDQVVVPPFPQRPQAPGFSAPNGIWSNGFPTGLPANGMPWMQQNLPYQLYPTPLQTNPAFQQQISMIPGLPVNFNALGGQPNFGGHPSLAPWPAGLDQNSLNLLQFGMGLQAQHASLPLNGGGELAVQSQGPQISQNLQPLPVNFNQGRGGGGGGGRRGHHRGRGRFGGGRGWHS